MAFTAQAADGRTVRYVDGKRYLWLMSLTAPMIPMIGIYWYVASGNPLTLLFPLTYTFVFVPLIDLMMGEDRHNPPEEIVAALSKDNYYRVLLYVAIALLYLDFFAVAWFIGTHSIPVWAFVGLTLGTGFASAGAILIGHELGHKNNTADKRAAQVVNALVGYGHFCIEHNRGHHVQVSTPEDFASSRMGESIYKFIRRETPGALRRGWSHERERLAKLGATSPWTWRNEILQSWALTAVVGAALIALFGWIMVPFLVVHHFYGWYGLTQANYVEHYGLLRQKLANGRYELCEPRHSWNTNHTYSNLISFHLQRHSDHHANALRPYQALRDFTDIPRLPSGYPGCFGMATIPWIWFRVMDPKVMHWAGGDITKVNIDPDKKDKLYAKYGKTEAEAVAA